MGELLVERCRYGASVLPVITARQFGVCNFDNPRQYPRAVIIFLLPAPIPPRNLRRLMRPAHCAGKGIPINYCRVRVLGSRAAHTAGTTQNKIVAIFIKHWLCVRSTTRRTRQRFQFWHGYLPSTALLPYNVVQTLLNALYIKSHCPLWWAMLNALSAVCKASRSRLISNFASSARTNSASRISIILQ